MTNNMEYEADSPLSYSVEEGELNSGRSSPGMIRENASECSTQTDEYDERVTTMRVEVANESTSEQQTQTALEQPTPMEIARINKERSTRPNVTDVRQNLESFRTRKYNKTDPTTTTQNTNIHSYQQNRPVRNISSQGIPFTSPSLPNYPTPVRPPPPRPRRMLLLTCIKFNNVYNNVGLKETRHT